MGFITDIKKMLTDNFGWFYCDENHVGHDSPKNRGGIRCVVGMMIVLAIIFLSVFFTSCKTRTVVVTVPEVRTDTTYITKAQRDSIWLHDSIYVGEKQKGDTIFMWKERWHTKYIENATHDTIYQATHDTITEVMPIEVVKEVPAKLGWWQKMLQGVGSIALILLLGWTIWQIAKFKMRRF